MGPKSYFVCSVARYAKMECLILEVDLSNPSDLRCAVCSVLHAVVSCVPRAACCVLCAPCSCCCCVLNKLCNGDWFPLWPVGVLPLSSQHSALSSRIRNSKIIVITLSLFSIAFIYCQVFYKLSLKRLISFSQWKRL
jgi:hypothetical protein